MALERMLGPTVALATALSIGSNWSLDLWSARLPWIPAVYQDVLVGASDVGLAVLVAYSGVVATGASTLRLSPRSTITIAAAGVLIVFLSLSAVGASAPLLSVASVALVCLGLAAYVAVVRRPRLLRWVLAGWAILVGLELPLVALQEATQSAIQIIWRAGLAFVGTPASALGAAVVFGPGGVRWQRALGTFAHPNVLGGFLAVVLVLGLPYLVGLTSKASERAGEMPGLRFLSRGLPRNKALSVVLAVWAVGWIELVLSFSRAALLAALVGCGIWLLGYGARRIGPTSLTWLLLTAPVAALVVGGTVAGSFLLPRLAPTPAALTAPAVSGRLMLGKVALALIQAHPLFGVGAGNFTLAELAPPFNAVAVDPVHVVPLLVAAEAGVPAGLAWLVVVLGGPIAEVVRRVDSNGADGAWLALPATLLVLALLDHYLWTLPAGRSMFWLGLAVWTATREDARTAAVEEDRRLGRGILSDGALRSGARG